MLQTRSLQHLAAGLNPEAVAAQLARFLGQRREAIPLHEPSFQGNEWRYVKACLDSGWVSSVGEYVDQFERELARYTGAAHAVAVVNGTAALHLALLSAGVEAEDEVLVPALSFVATANAVAYCGAIPHFVDVEHKSLGVDAMRLQTYLQDLAEVRDGHCYNRHSGRRLRALVVMHAFGHPADLGALRRLCDQYHLALIEDAAEALGSFYKDRHVGLWGDVSILSFNGNKILTCGGGGAVLTNDPERARRIHHLSTTAKRPHAWEYEHDEIGYNYRLPNLNAALGLAQLEQLDGFLAAKRDLARAYQDWFADHNGLRIFREPAYARSNYWLNLLLLHPEHLGQRGRILTATHKRGLLTRPAWRLLNELPMFQRCPAMPLNNARQLQMQIICLPSGAGLQVHG